MPASSWFWIIYAIVLVNGLGYGFLSPSLDRRWLGGGIVGMILVGLLGWGIFGPPIK